MENKFKQFVNDNKGFVVFLLNLVPTSFDFYINR